MFPTISRRAALAATLALFLAAPAAARQDAELPPPPGPDAAALVADARATLRAAVAAREPWPMEKLAERLADVPDADPLAWLARYYEGLAWYRRGELSLDRDDEKTALRALDRASDTLGRLVEARPKLADAHAVLGAAYAGQITMRRWKRVFWSSRSREAFETAAELEPANPRVWLLRGVSAWRAAKNDAEREAALRLLERAAELYEMEPQAKAMAAAPEGLAPDWGPAEAWGYIALVHMDLGELTEARVALERAGFADPDSVWITVELQDRLAKLVTEDRED